MASRDDEFDLDSEDFELDDWGMGDDLDGGDFLSDTPAKDDRNPALRLGGKFVSGLGKTFVDPNVQRRMIKDNLPDGFAAAYDAGATGVNAFNDIKREVDRNLGSIVSEAKSTLTRVSPTIEKQLPQALAKRLNEFTSKHGMQSWDSGNYNPEDQERQSGMASFLEQVEAFKLKEETTKRNVMNRKEARLVRSDAMQQRLLDEGNRASAHTNAILNRLLGYHTEVTTNFQMKSLELQYNQFFMLRKSVDIGEQQLSLSKDSYDKIIKNTGLPDALKLRTLEHAEFLAKEGILTKLNGKFSETVGSFVQKGVKQIGENLSGKAEELKSAMGELESMVGMLDMLNSMEDEPPGAREQVLRQLESVFGMIGGIAGGQVEKIARKYAEKKSLKTNGKLVKYSEKIKAFMGNGAQRINSYLTGEADTGVGFLDDTVRGLIGGSGWSQDSKLATNNYDNLGESSYFDYRTKRTINDIIPGYLKLIHHELRMTRTGDENLSPISFDWEKNKFDDDKSIGKRITEKFTGKDSVITSNAEGVNKFINAIDPGKELSKETRKALGAVVAENMAKGGSIFDVYSLINNFNPQGPKAQQQRDELNSFMEARGFDVYADTSSEVARAKTINRHDETANKFYNAFNSAANQARYDYESQNDQYQKLIDLGYGQHLADAGLVTQDEDGGWSVDQNNIDKKTQRRAYKGFATGGWTGPGGKYQPKGFVHGDEFVVRSEVVKQPGVKGFLDRLNTSGKNVLNNIAGYATGGEVQETSTGVNGNKAGVSLESIIEAIRSISPVEYLKSMGQSIKGIEFTTMRNLMGNVEQLPQQLRSYYENNIKNAKPGVSLKQTWDRFTDRAKQNKIWDSIKGGAEDLSNNQTIKDLQEAVSNKFNANTYDDVANYQADIYTEDDPEHPKLTVDGFKNGEYFDELTGQPVRSAKDIRGTVVDAIGNVKLHGKDLLKKLKSPSTYVRGILSGTKFTNSMVGKGFDAAVKFGAKHDLWGKLKQGLKWTKSKLSHLNSDVYLEGQPDPVLFLKDIKDGNLYNGEREQITDYKHITGHIYDKEGNIVLREEDYADVRLVGADGKPLKGFMRKQLRRIKNAAKLGWTGVKGFNQFRKKAWQAQFKLMYGVKDVIAGTRKKKPEDLEAERYNAWMMGNANPDGHDEYANGWDRFKGKVKGFQKDTRDYLTGERDKRKASEANVGQLVDHDGNDVAYKQDAFDKMSSWLKGKKDGLVNQAKDKYSQAKDTTSDLAERARLEAWHLKNTINNPDRETGQTLTGKLGTKLNEAATGAKGKIDDLAERARLEAWLLTNTVNNPDRDTGETLTGKTKAGFKSIMAKVKDSIPEWLNEGKEDADELKQYKAKLREYWIKEKKEQFSGFVTMGKSKVKKINWKDAEKTLKSFTPTKDDITYELKKFEMHLKDKGLDKESLSKSAREKSDKLMAKVKQNIPEWMEEFTTDDDEVKRYKSTLRKKWVEEQTAAASGKANALKKKAKLNWNNAKKQLEGMLPDEEQKANFRNVITGAKKSISDNLTAGKAKFSAVTGKWGLDKDEKGTESKEYRDKSMPRLVRDIHRLLDERLSPPKKGLWSDSDGNGFREGSVEDQLADREKNAKKDSGTGQVIVKDEKKKPKGLLGILMAIVSTVGAVGTAIAGLVTKVMGFGKFVKEWMAKQAALKAAAAISGAGKCCCGGGGDDYLDRDSKKNKRKGKTARRVPKPATGGGNAGKTASRIGTKLARGPGWMKVAGLAALAGGGALAYSSGASASEVGTDIAKESLRATPGVGTAVDAYDAYNEYSDKEPTEERGDNPGFFNNLWNGTKDTLGLNTADGVADFAKDTAIGTAGMAAVTGGIGGALAGTGAAAGVLAALGGPITLGIIAGGAAIYGGIKLYQALKKGDKPLLSFRMAQYGFKDSSKSEINSILKLEDVLFKTTRAQGTKVGFAKPEEAVALAIKTLGIDTQSPLQVKYFSQWFNARFKPVFFSWVATIANIKKGATLEKLDETFKPQEKLDIMATVHGEARSLGAYNVTTSFDASKTLLDATAVDKVYKANQTNVEDPRDRAGKEKAAAAKLDQTVQKSSAVEMQRNSFNSANEKESNSNSGGIWNSIKNSAVGSTIGQAAKDTGNAISSAWDSAKNAASNFVASMSGSQKEWQMRVYQAFKNAGFSEQQSRILTAEIGRENSYNPKIMFGGHADPHSGTNLGMLSWQGARTPKLVKFLGEAGVLDKKGNMIPGQAALNAQAKFIMWEMNNTHKKAAAEFLSNPNIDYAKGAYIVGKKYILWRIDDPKYGPGGKKNRDGFYNMLVKQLGGGAKATPTDEATNAKPAVAPKNSAGIPVTLAKPGTNSPGMSLDPSKKPNVSGMAMPGAPKAASSGAGILADPNKSATVGNTMGNGDAKFANCKAVKAAKLATQKALGSSSGYCARYVANALQGAGYKFTRQASAFMYHTNKILSGMGFVAIDSTKYQIGDVAVWPAHGGPGGGGTHGHIQIYNGKNWVSDFIQNNFIPGKHYKSSKPTVYRDKEILHADVKIAVDSGKAGSELTNDNNTTDSQGVGGEGSTTSTALNSKYENMTVADIVKKRKEGKVKVYAADGSSTDYTPGAATSDVKTPAATKSKTQVTSATNPNNTSLKPTTTPTSSVAAPAVAAGGIVSATSGGTAVDTKKDTANQQAAAVAQSKPTNGTNQPTPTQAQMRSAQMSNNSNVAGNTSANFPAESIRLFTSMDSKLSQVVTALNKLAVINQDGVKAQVEASNRQAVALNETAKAVTTVATVAVNNKGKDDENSKSNSPSMKPGVIGAGKPQPVSVLS